MTEFGPTASFNTERYNHVDYIISYDIETCIIIIIMLLGVKPSMKLCDRITFTATERHPAVILQQSLQR